MADINNHRCFARWLFFRQWNLVAKHISRNHFVDISTTLGQKRLFRQMGYNLFAKVTVLPKGYYFRAKGAAEGDERRGKRKIGSGRREIQSLPFFTCYRILYLRIVQY